MRAWLRGYVPKYLNNYGPHVHDTHMSAYTQTGGQTAVWSHRHRETDERTGGHAYVTGGLRTWNLKD